LFDFFDADFLVALFAALLAVWWLEAAAAAALLAV
jgi:hypothetical protein